MTSGVSMQAMTRSVRGIVNLTALAVAQVWTRSVVLHQDGFRKCLDAGFGVILAQIFDPRRDAGAQRRVDQAPYKKRDADHERADGHVAGESYERIPSPRCTRQAFPTL